MHRLQIFVVSLFLLAPSVVAAQDHKPSVVWGVAKAVLIDPTTYAPATMSYVSQRMDWKTSQPLFENGWLEHNPRFTVSGRPDDQPFSYGTGNRQIARTALRHLQGSLIHNASSQIFERVLATKYPQHRKLFKTLAWIERIGYSSYVAYLASANHFEQTQKNIALAKQYGYAR